MLEQLLVELEYPFTANCAKCNHILFEIRIIDQFIKVHDKKCTDKVAAAKDAAKFYMLHSEILPSTVLVEKSSFLCQEKMFYMQFLGEVKCDICKQRIGIKMLTVSSDFHYPELLDRHLIDVTKVSIKTQKEDVTNQLLQRFYEEWDNQGEIDDIQLPEKTKPAKFDQKAQTRENSPKKQKNKKPKKQERNKREGKNENELSKQNSLREEQEIKFLRKQLQQQSQQNKQVVQEIIASIDFFNQVLVSLQKRVSQTENVCNVLKEKIEKMLPLLRKKNQQ